MGREKERRFVRFEYDNGTVMATDLDFFETKRVKSYATRKYCLETNSKYEPVFRYNTVNGGSGCRNKRSFFNKETMIVENGKLWLKQTPHYLRELNESEIPKITLDDFPPKINRENNLNCNSTNQLNSNNEHQIGEVNPPLQQNQDSKNNNEAPNPSCALRRSQVPTNRYSLFHLPTEGVHGVNKTPTTPNVDDIDFNADVIDIVEFLQSKLR